MRTLAHLGLIVIGLLFLGFAAEELTHLGTARAEATLDPYGIGAQHLRQCGICRARHLSVADLLADGASLPCCRSRFHANGD